MPPAALTQMLQSCLRQEGFLELTRVRALLPSAARRYLAGHFAQLPLAPPDNKHRKDEFHQSFTARQSGSSSSGDAGSPAQVPVFLMWPGGAPRAAAPPSNLQNRFRLKFVNSTPPNFAKCFWEFFPSQKNFSSEFIHMAKIIRAPGTTDSEIIRDSFCK